MPNTTTAAKPSVPVKYLENAPADLIKDHQTKRVSDGYAALEALVSHPSMGRVWKELAKRPHGEGWARHLFAAVKVLSHGAMGGEGLKQLAAGRKVTIKRPKSRTDVKAEYQKIARRARSLAELIEGSKLDQQVFEYAPADLMAAYGIADWDKLTSEQRQDSAFSILGAWPHITEVLDLLAKAADAQAQSAVTEPRLVDRYTIDQESKLPVFALKHFVRGLVAYMRREYKGPMYGTVANISNAVFGIDLEKRDVEKLIRGDPLAA